MPQPIDRVIYSNTREGSPRRDWYTATEPEGQAPFTVFTGSIDDPRTVIKIDRANKPQADHRHYPGRVDPAPPAE